MWGEKPGKEICLMIIIDAHNHLGGPDLTDKAKQSAEELVFALDQAGVDKAVVFPFNNPDAVDSFFEPNNVIAKAMERFPGRLIGFGRLDPHQEEKALKEQERIFLNLGLKGLKLHPKAQQFSLDNPWLHKILERAAEFGVPVVFDSGTSYAPWAAVAKLAAGFPNVTFIMAHMRGQGFLEVAREYPNIYLGTTDVFNLALIEETVASIGAHRIISGSDSPYFSPQKEQEKINSLNLHVEEKELILGGNIEKILRRG